MIPTPTPLPTPAGTPMFGLESISWGAELSTNAIQGWNTVNQDGLLTQFQWFIILAIVFLGIGAIMVALQKVSS